jgi:uncharacterized membrane protein YqjE
MAYIETNQLGGERRETRSVPQLMRDFIDEVTALLRDEVRLARGEMKDNLAELRNGLLFLGAGAIVLIAGLVTLLNAAVVALMPHVPTTALWLAPFIVGLVVVLIGAGMLWSGRAKVAPDSLAPERTLRQSRRDQRLVKEHLS